MFAHDCLWESLSVNPIESSSTFLAQGYYKSNSFYASDMSDSFSLLCFPQCIYIACLHTVSDLFQEKFLYSFFDFTILNPS